ncbi:hypothetical protein GALL_388480 [mine drainage metagenome]|uniref:Uncharacterized protein n=1 Tax=mine drainage metagenome TaxID=410659 RepID=A0A1J5Q8B7_9ZZZZ
MVPALRQRLVLVVRGPVRQLRRGDVEDPLAGPLGDEVHEPQQVLGRVAEAHPTPDARLEVRRRARHVERDHALVLVPDVDHPVELLVAARDAVAGEQVGPVGDQRVERRVGLLRRGEPGEEVVRAGLVDDLQRGDPGVGVCRGPLLVGGVLDVPEDERVARRLAGREAHLEAVRRDRVPAARDRAGGLPGERYRRLAERVVRADERVAVRVEACGLGVDPVDGVVVAALAVLGLVVDRAARAVERLDLDLADRQVALVVGLVVLRVPQCELDEREQRDGLRGVGRVGQGDLLDLGVLADRDEEQRLDAEPAALTRDPGVPEAVAALEVVEIGLDRHPRRGPDVATVVDVEVATTGVGGDVVVAVARQPTHLRVAVERVPTGLVREQREEPLGPEVVDPRVGGVGRGDDVFTGLVIEVSVPHGDASQV